MTPKDRNELIERLECARLREIRRPPGMWVPVTTWDGLEPGDIALVISVLKEIGEAASRPASAEHVEFRNPQSYDGD